jgi:hypothetical protein
MLLFILIFIAAFLLQIFLPWWCMVIVAFAISMLLGKNAGQVFFAGFFACGTGWLAMAIYIHFTGGDLMTHRVAELFSLPGNAILYAVTFLVPAIVGGIAALSGFFLQEIFRRKKLITGTW